MRSVVVAQRLRYGSSSPADDAHAHVPVTASVHQSLDKRRPAVDFRQHREGACAGSPSKAWVPVLQVCVHSVRIVHSETILLGKAVDPVPVGATQLIPKKSLIACSRGAYIGLPFGPSSSACSNICTKPPPLDSSCRTACSVSSTQLLLKNSMSASTHAYACTLHQLPMGLNHACFQTTRSQTNRLSSIICIKHHYETSTAPPRSSLAAHPPSPTSCPS